MDGGPIYGVKVPMMGWGSHLWVGGFSIYGVGVPMHR